jgi:hypothetical protein
LIQINSHAAGGGHYYEMEPEPVLRDRVRRYIDLYAAMDDARVKMLLAEMIRETCQELRRCDRAPPCLRAPDRACPGCDNGR